MDRLLTTIHSPYLLCSGLWLYLGPWAWSTNYSKVFGSTLAMKDFSLEFEMSRVETAVGRFSGEAAWFSVANLE